MDVSEALTLAAIVVALGIGVMSLLQTRSIQRRQYRQNILDEVVAWARDIVECEAEFGIPLDLAKAESLGEEARRQFQKGVYWAGLANLVLKYQAIRNRSGYVKVIASESSAGLYLATERTTELLAVYLQSLTQHRDGQDNADACEHNLHLLLKGVVELMNKAAETRSELACSRPPLCFCSRIMGSLKRK